MKKCQEWLEKNHADMYEKLYSSGTFDVLIQARSDATQNHGQDVEAAFFSVRIYF